MAKKPFLPPHVKISKTGVYQFRRRVPDALRPELGHEVKRSLGRDYGEMLKRHAALEAQTAKAFSQKPRANSNVRQKVLSKMREYGLPPHETMSLIQSGVDPDNVDDRFYAFDAMLDELAEDPALDPDLIRALSRGDSPLTLELALDDYCDYRVNEAPHREKAARQAIERHKAVLVAAIGRDAVCRRPLARISRADARQVRDRLLDQVAPSTARRVLNDISAAVRRAVREHDLNTANPFADLEVPNSQHTRDQRHPLDDEDMAALAPIMETDDDLGIIWQTLRDTGARSGEIVGLRGQDIDVANHSIRIQAHEGRGVKTANSEREIPIPDTLCDELAKRIGKDRTAPLFPQYARERGGDACSQALVKRLRRVVKDTRKTAYSLRHRMKDLLRDTDCPENLAREIMGHSDQSSAANYGRGYSLARKRKALRAAWERSERGIEAAANGLGDPASR